MNKKYVIKQEKGLVSIYWDSRLISLGRTLDIALDNIESYIIRNKIKRSLKETNNEKVS